MQFTETFIRRPVMTTLVMISLLLFGVLGYLLLPTSDLPPVDYPTIQVNASLPGASPETMASAVATPLEKQFSDIQGLAFMNSNNFQGNTNINLQFDLSRNIDAAAQDVQAAISAAILPAGMPNPPTYKKVNAAQQPVLYLTMSSDFLPMTEVTYYAETFLSRRISTVQGVSQVVVYGEKLYAARVQLDPKALATRGIGIGQVAAAVSAANQNQAAGLVEDQHQALTLEPQGQLMRAKLFNPVIVSYQAGGPVRIADLGQAVDGVEWKRGGAWWKGKESIVLAVKRQPGANTVEVVEKILALLPAARQQIPPAVNLEVMYDQSIIIKESVRDVKFTLMLAVALVVMVVFLFLKNLSATVITSLAVPLSLVATFAVMYAFSFNLDTISLMALTLAVGFVVDDAIVMLENIFRHLEMGKSRLQAALDGAKEIGFTIVSMTLSLAVVFLPVVFMSGMVGRILNEFAVTITMAILVSGLVSLSLTPMLASRFLRETKGDVGAGDPLKEGGPLWRGVMAVYNAMLRWCLHHRLITILISLALLLGTVQLFRVIPKGFIPSEDQDYLIAFTLASEGISFKAMERHTNALAAIMAQDPAVEGVLPVVGTSYFGAMNNSILIIKLKDRERRTASADQVMIRLRPRLFSVPGILCFLQNPPAIQLSVQQTNAPYQFTLQSAETDTLYKVSQQLLAKLQALPQIRDVNSDLKINSPQLSIVMDRDRASTLGVTAADIENYLYSAFADRQVSYIYASSDTYKVILELLPQYQRQAADLADLYLATKGGKMVPLTEVVSLERILGPLQVNHVGQLPSVTISFNIRPGVSLGAATAAVQQAATENLPPTVTGSFRGQAEEFEKSMTSLYLLLALAVAVIYLLLGVLYESFIHPITVLAGLPSAALGALLTLWIFGEEMDLYAMVGIIMLVGIVKKNAIMMIDFALEAERSKGLSTLESIYQGALIRCRPIMMTSVAAFAGILPIAIGVGAGGGSRQALGLAVCGGLVVSQLVTLLITPVIYTYLDQFQSWVGRRGKSPAPAAGGSNARG
ncbi:MAG: efflux RND transporter permease subunit [Desulfarculus sp.]|nr:MAG: efflux RND transporter permease subunit [Desulfarculus sp.]